VTQRVAEQVVQLQRPRVVADHGDEEVQPLQRVEVRPGPRVAGERLAAGRVELVQHARLQQEFAQPVVELREHLGGEEVEGLTVDRAARASAARPDQRQAQARRPAQRSLVQGLGSRRLDAGRRQQRQRLVAREAQVGGAQFGQQAGGAQPRQAAQRRLATRGDGHRPALGKARQHAVDEGERLRIVDMVQVVERDHAMRKLALLEGVDDLVGGPLLVARVGAGGHRGQCLG
jgi:hypothetical protein